MDIIYNQFCLVNEQKAVLEMLSNSTAHMELVMLTDKENKVTFDPVVAMGTLGKGCYDHKWLMTAQLDWKGN